MQAVFRSVISSSGLDHPRFLHQLLAVHDLDARALKREQDRRLHRVDADRLAEQSALLELDADLLGHVLGPAGLRRHRAAERGDAGARAAVAEPRVVELVVARRRAEVPHDRLVALGEEAEAVQLVLRPRADVRGRDVADVRHVEAEQRAQLRLGEQRRDARQALLAEAVEAHALLPVDGHRPVRVQSHVANDCTTSVPGQPGRTLTRRQRVCKRLQAMPDFDFKDKTLGWVGTGRMGYALATRLLEAGCDVAVYNRTRSKAEPLAELGATVVDTPAEPGRPRHRLHDGRGPGGLQGRWCSARTGCCRAPTPPRR